MENPFLRNQGHRICYESFKQKVTFVLVDGWIVARFTGFKKHVFSFQRWYQSKRERLFSKCSCQGQAIISIITWSGMFENHPPQTTFFVTSKIWVIHEWTATDNPPFSERWVIGSPPRTVLRWQFSLPYVREDRFKLCHVFGSLGLGTWYILPTWMVDFCL